MTDWLKGDHHFFSVAATQVPKPEARSKPVGPQIKFEDEDDDDILSGLGLGEDKKTSVPKIASSKTSSLAPQHKARGTQDREHLATPTPTDEDGDEEETVQFGGYVPSMVDPSPKSSSVARRRKAKSIPITAPHKKMVRFSDQLEDERPRPSPHGAVTTRDKKVSDPMEEEEIAWSAESPITSRNRGPPPSSGRDESTPSPNFPSRDSPSLGPSAPDDELSDAAVLSGPLEVPAQSRTRSASEGVRLEHPMFPWQKARHGDGNRRSMVSTSSPAPPSSSSSSSNVMPASREGVVVPSVRVDGDPAAGAIVKSATSGGEPGRAMEGEKAECARLEVSITRQTVMPQL